MARYKTILKEISKIQPKTIMEIGTWRGVRARKMLQQAAKYNKDVMYFGFDIFDAITEEQRQKELHTKWVATESIAREEINKTGCQYKLIIGDTHDTLPNFNPDVPIDLVFIDGGHSLETIASDWGNVKRLMHKGTSVIFDDYYENKEGVGCKSLIDSLCTTDFNVTLLEPLQKIHGVLIRLVKVTKA
jgi:predicted O-methyltransferase YrrM